VRRLVRLAAAGALVVALGACDPARGDGPATTLDDEVAKRAEPLLDAHERLERFDALVADGEHDTAVRGWPEIEARVRGAADAVDPDAPGLGSEGRSTLRGYIGGLRISADAWSEVHEALRAGDEAAVADGAERARQRMRHLADLRASAFGVRASP
jgi:hypothetical protein